MSTTSFILVSLLLFSAASCLLALEQRALVCNDDYHEPLVASPGTVEIFSRANVAVRGPCFNESTPVSCIFRDACTKELISYEASVSVTDQNVPIAHCQLPNLPDVGPVIFSLEVSHGDVKKIFPVRVDARENVQSPDRFVSANLIRSDDFVVGFEVMWKYTAPELAGATHVDVAIRYSSMKNGGFGSVDFTLLTLIGNGTLNNGFLRSMAINQTAINPTQGTTDEVWLVTVSKHKNTLKTTATTQEILMNQTTLTAPVIFCPIGYCKVSPNHHQNKTNNNAVYKTSGNGFDCIICYHLDLFCLEEDKGLVVSNSCGRKFSRLTCQQLQQNCYWHNCASNKQSGLAFGAGHFTTFDGLNMTFLGQGEFYLVTPNTDLSLSPNQVPTVQMRQTRLYPSYEFTTWFSAFAIRMPHPISPTIVQVETTRTGLNVLINGTSLRLEAQNNMTTFKLLPGHFLLTVDRSNRHLAISNDFIGIRIQRRSSQVGPLSIAVEAGSRHFELTDSLDGILGNYNNDLSDDLTGPDGSQLRIGTNLREQHLQLVKWRVKKEDSLFTYKNGTSYENFTDVDYFPQYYDFLDTMILPEEERIACNFSRSCRYDYVATNNNATISTETAFEERMLSARRLARVTYVPHHYCISSTIKAPDNGYKVVFAGDTVAWGCHPTFRLQGPSSTTCLANGTWTKPTTTQCINELPAYVCNQTLIGSLNRSEREAGRYLNNAVLENKTHEVTCLLRNLRSIDFEQRNIFGNTPLVTAAAENLLTMVEVLLAEENVAATSQPMLNAGTCNNNFTALHHAALHGNVALGRLLLEKGADVNAPDHTARTPLYTATVKNNSAFVELLLQHGATVDATDKRSRSSLYVAAYRGFDQIAKILLAHNASTTIFRDTHDSPLVVAAYGAHKNVVRLLLDHGADINWATRYGETSLWWAARLGYIEIAKMLLSETNQTVNLEAANEYGRTALHATMEREHYEITKLLIEHGADIHATDNQGLTPLHVAAERNAAIAAELLIETGGPWLMEVSDNHGRRPLHFAVIGNSDNVARLLLERGCVVDPVSNYLTTPLHIAAHRDHYHLAEILLDYGASLHAPDSEGKTAFDLSASDEITRLLDSYRSQNQFKKCFEL